MCVYSYARFWALGMELEQDRMTQLKALYWYGRVIESKFRDDIFIIKGLAIDTKLMSLISSTKYTIFL